MGYQSEAQLENLLVAKLTSQGYTQIDIKDKEALEQNFKEQLFQFNKKKLGGKEFTEAEFRKIMTHIDNESIHKCAKKLRDKLVLTRDDGSSVYLDFLSKDWSENIYQVTNQVTMVGSYRNRYDVTILANGLPIIQIELKRRGLDIKEAFNQVLRYRKHSLYSGLYKYIQIFVVSNGVDI